MFYPLRVPYKVKYERLALREYLFRRALHYAKFTSRKVECCASQNWEYIWFNVRGWWMHEQKGSTKDRKRSKYTGTYNTSPHVFYSLLCIGYTVCIWNTNSNTVEPDRPQHYSPAAFVIAQQNFSVTFISLPFHSRKQNRRDWKKNVGISVFVYLLKMCNSEIGRLYVACVSAIL
jgi:hypothetical protein